MFGSRIYGKKEVISEILDHDVFKEGEGRLTKKLVGVFGQLYIRLLGWPNSEARSFHHRIVRLLQPCPSDTILDVGCGTGIHTFEISSRFGATIIGIDIDERDIRFVNNVREINHINNCRFTCMDATTLSFESESFDKIICIAVLEHIDDDNLAVRNIARILRKGGVLVGVVPNDERLRFKPECFQGRDDPKGHGHVREGYSVKQIESLMLRNGLQLVKYEYVSGLTQNIMRMIEKRTNKYLAFPFTYPIIYLSSRFSNRGTDIMFKAVKKSSRKAAQGKRII
jgi:ubiquinone/menaquinone biosynthesis C-methylase UbiE